MSEPQENDPLGLSEDEPQGEPEDATAAALWEDLKAYDNPEVFYDPNLPQVYLLNIVEQAFLPDRMPIVQIHLDGRNLNRGLHEATFRFIGWTNEAKNELINSYKVQDWHEVKLAIMGDEDFVQLQSDMYLFFVRNFPKLTVRVYNIAVLLSVLSGLTQIFDEKQMRDEKERTLKVLLRASIREFERDIKKMLGTRSSGRPTKIERGPLPEIVQQVLDIAQAGMGDKRGKDAVPGLKGIANVLDTSEDALGQRLRRAGFPWTIIRTHLEKLT
jgi:hypothetical protein